MRIHGALALTAASALTAALAACSGGGTTPPSHHTTTANAAAATTPAAPASSSAPAAPAGLTGTWHGRYGGAYAGTFVLSWRQSGSSLSGRIHISNPGDEVAIHGTLSGASITFGTVGSTAITYTGTTSGGAMSGHWQISGTGQGGTWSAAKS